MGSVNNLYACCSACQGLFSDLDMFAVHCSECGGDVKSSPCSLVACKKSLYLSFLNWKSALNEGLENRSNKLWKSRGDSVQDDGDGNHGDLFGDDQEVAGTVTGRPLPACSVGNSGHRGRRRQKVAPWRRHLRKRSESCKPCNDSNQLDKMSAVSPPDVSKISSLSGNTAHPDCQTKDEPDAKRETKKIKTVDRMGESRQIKRTFVIRTRRQKMMDDKACCSIGRTKIVGGKKLEAEKPSKVELIEKLAYEDTDDETEGTEMKSNEEREILKHRTFVDWETEDVDSEDSDEGEGEIQGDEEPCDDTLHDEIQFNQGKRKCLSLSAMNFKESELKDEGRLVYECTTCHYKTKHLGMCQRHCRAHNGGGSLQCPDCSFQTDLLRLYKRHMDSHTRFQCPHCDRSYTRPHDRDRHIQMIHSGNPQFYTCDDCDYRTKFKNMLREHVLKHTDSRLACPYDDCSFATVYKRSLQVHLWTVHSTVKSLQCDQCSYRTQITAQLNRHMLRHKADRPYQCPQCSYRAGQMSYLKRHLLTHDHVKKFFCDQCRYGCSRASSLRLHLMSHIGVKPWECSLCNYRSIQRQKITRHIKTRHPNALHGEPVRRNLVLRIDVDQYKEPSGPQHGVDLPEMHRTIDHEKQDPVDIKDAKWYVVQAKDEAASSALPSSLISGEVVVGEIPTTEAHGGLDVKEGAAPCTYQCAFCEYMSGALNDVQEHLKDSHPDDGSDEIPMLANMETVTVSGEHDDALASPGVSEQNIMIFDSHGDPVTVTFGQEETVTFTDAQAVEEAVIEEGVQQGSHVNEIAGEEELVSTAVESILHLQQVVANVNC